MESPLCAPGDPGFRLIETLLWTPGTGCARRVRHLARLGRTAARLGIVPQGVEAALDAVAGEGPMRVRLTVDRSGRTDVVAAPFVPLAEGTVWGLVISDERLASGDPWLGVKTTERGLYDRVRKAMPEGAGEVIFCNEDGCVCEGTITNVFVREGNVLLTPPLSEGVLPGVLREELLEQGEAREARLRPEDLAGRGVFVGNSLRGLIAARVTSR